MQKELVNMVYKGKRYYKLFSQGMAGAIVQRLNSCDTVPPSGGGAATIM